MTVSPVRRSQLSDWKRMRATLWPECPEADHTREMAEILGDPEFNAAFLAHAPDGLPVGFLEASIRLTAEGCRPGRIGYLEGWYVEPEWRGRGLGAALVQAAEAWAVERGCREMASDAEIENAAGRQAHAHLGYQETSRLAHFRKDLRGR
jgi:aminoglycoside 6'-N-acetyltransferase I